MRTTHLNGCSTKAVLRKNRSHHTAWCQAHERQVKLTDFFNARTHHRKLESCDGAKVLGLWQGQIDRHGSGLSKKFKIKEP
jgi:uncharacterized protein (UPF0548 family)